MTRSQTSSDADQEQPSTRSLGLTALRMLPGVAGAALVAAGCGVIYWPAGVIVAGLLLLALDRRI